MSTYTKTDQQGFIDVILKLFLIRNEKFQITQEGVRADSPELRLTS